MTYSQRLTQTKLFEGYQSFDLSFDKHIVSVSVLVSRHLVEGNERFKSRTQCEPYCNDGPTAEEVNSSIDDLHAHSFGLGGWVYAE